MAADGEGFSGWASGPGARGLVEPAPDRRLAHAAAFRLMSQPGKSAAQTLGEGQRRVLARLYAVLGSIGLLVPGALLGIAGIAGLVVFAAILVFRIVLYRAGQVAPPEAPEADLGDADDWPVYTLLIALKDEAETAPQLAAAIGAR